MEKLIIKGKFSKVITKKNTNIFLNIYYLFIFLNFNINLTTININNLKEWGKEYEQSRF